MFNKKDKEYLQKNIEKKIDDLDKKVESVKSSAQKQNSGGNSNNSYGNGGKKDPYEYLKASDPNSPIGKRLTEMYKDKQRQDDRDKLIAALEEKQTQGEATLAEKIELMNLNLQKSLPKDFVDGMKSMGDTMKKGASQMGAGMNVITQKLMMSNPLTAMLYQNRALFGAVGNIGIGALRMGWGALKGIGTGTGSMVKAASSVFSRRKKGANASGSSSDENGSTGTATVGGDVTETSEGAITTDEQSENIANIENLGSDGSDNYREEINGTTAKRIAEIHELFFKKKKLQQQEDEEKKKQSILSKGLSGLGNTMKSVSGLVDTIMAKQKLILGAVLLGGVAILGIAAWFKSGGMGKLLNGLLQKFTGEPNPEEYKPTMKDSINTSILKGEDYSKYLDENASNFTGISKGLEVPITSSDGTPTLGAGNEKEYTFETGELTPVLAPFDGECIGFRKLTTENTKGQPQVYFQIDLFTPYYVPVGAKTGKAIKVRFDYVINPKITNAHGKDYNKVVKGQIIGYSNGRLKMTELQDGDATGIVNEYTDFTNKAAQNNFKENIDITKKALSKKGMEQKVNDTIFKTIRGTEIRNQVLEAKERGVNWLTDPFVLDAKMAYQTMRSVDDDYVNKHLQDIVDAPPPESNNRTFLKGENAQIPLGDIPTNNLNQGSNNGARVDNNNKTISDAEAQKAAQNPTSGANNNSDGIKKAQATPPIILSNNSGDGDMSAEMFNSSQFAAASNYA